MPLCWKKPGIPNGPVAPGQGQRRRAPARRCVRSCFAATKNLDSRCRSGAASAVGKVSRLVRQAPSAAPLAGPGGARQMELVSGGRQRATSLPLVLVLTSISFFMVALDALVVVTALPEIHRSLG